MEYYHLTTPQQNIWNLQKYYKGTAIANLCGAVFFQEKRDDALLRRALSRLIHSQSGIRLCFSEEGEEVRQYVSEEVNEDISVRTFRSREEFDSYAESFAKAPIGLSERQMYRFVVFHLEQENRSGILVVLSHLISDAWTFGLMANQMDVAYQQLAREEGLTLLEGNYTDFIRSEDTYFASKRYERDKSYWEEKYPVRPEESPVKLRSASADSVEAGRVTRTLPLSLEQGIEVYCKNHLVTEAVLFETALIIYLSRINPDIQAVTIGVPVLNRSNAREKEIAGMFVSTMPLTVAVTEDTGISELAGQITKGHMDLFRHQKYPYAGILRQLREKQDFSGNLYDVMVSYQNAKTKTGADTKWYSNGCSEVPLLIHIDNRDGKECHTINVDYQTAVFRDEAEVELLIERLEYILEQIVAEAVEKVGDIGIVPKREYDRIVYEFNDTYVDYPREKCIHELFMEQAAKTPERIALVFEDQKFTYRQLDEMSNSLAYFLREKGVGANDVVPIIAKKSWYVVVAMLGILKAGGAYMPIDPDYPRDRIQYIINEAKSKVGCTLDYHTKLENIEFLPLDIFLKSYVKVDSQFKDKSYSKAKDLCYVIYTSGSTGMPKGVMITHHNLYNYLMSIYKLYEISDYNMSLITNMYVDLSVTAFFVPLLAGGVLEIVNQDIAHGLKTIMDKKNGVYKFTPTYIDIMRETNTFLPFDVVCILGGEAIKRKDIEYICHRGKLIDEYGPTEATVGCCIKKYNKDVKNPSISIGKPILNTQIYILDKADKIVPIGVPGELCIAGEGVGKGYLNRPELTAERFVSNPFARVENHHGEVMYRTGDLARFRSDGEIEYLGRMDTQVKIRGLRIELGEIESVMGSFPGIGLCAVADKSDETSRQYLVGYYTADREIDEKELRRLLSAKLPKYMVPNYFVRLEAMPMTASGKTDRKSLPVPDFTRQTAEYAPPETDMEKRLAEIWQELLHMERVGRTDDFFELGGDSLLAISMLSEIEKNFHVEVSVRKVMEHSELAALARCLEDICRSVCPDTADGGMSHGTAAGRITACHADRYPLLPQQKAVYAACMKEPGSLVYNMPARISLPNAVDRDKLKGSIARVLNRHKLLKSYIRMEGTGLYGVYDRDARIVFEEYEAGKEDVFVRPFDLRKAPLVRVGFTEDSLLFDMHHIIADGVSMNILLREIAAVYGGGELQEQGAEYPDYAEYFYGMDTREHKAYFRKMLKCDWEPVTLPETKKPGTGGESRLYKIPKEVFSEARKYARESGLTDTMVFLGAYGILLSKYTGRKEILSSIILQNRIHADVRGMVGMFVNTLPVCLALGKSAGMRDSVKGYMQEVKEMLLELFRYQELPFEDISEVVGMNDRSVVNTSFVYQGDGEKTLSLDGQELAPLFMDTYTAKFDLSMELTPTGNGCRFRLEYNMAKYDGQLMDALAEGYIRILGQLGKEKLADITVLSEEDYHRIVEGFNETYVDYPREKCVHELFMEQTAKTPERIALVFENQEFTYRQLDQMSNSLAHFLRRRGIQTGDVVPIIAKRSWHVVVAMLGVLKAGGAYMPIDPNYPEDRINYMLETAGSRFVLVYGYERMSGETIRLDCFGFEENVVPVGNINSPEDPAYIIFTSGSTGKPKGVTVCHRNICNYADDNAFNNVCHKMIDYQCQRIVSVTSIIFDIFVTESLLPLVNGLCIYFASDEEVGSQRRLSRLVKKNDIDVLQTTPTKMRSYLMDRGNTGYMKGLKAIILGGEAFPQELYHTLRNLTDAHIYNIYGPAETTVWSTNAEVTGDDITIGTPIANTQIYILDSDRRPVPIGVPGELCIAGEGVGKGYLNRPELTAERFVSNPFATMENHHGKVMYRTGDLARFRKDGEIEYLGRMDTQVKIRGLRVELGEIESVMGSFPGIGLCAVTDKRDETGRQYLVGYYTKDAEVCRKADDSEAESSKAVRGKMREGQGAGKSEMIAAGPEIDSGLDEKALRAHLSAKLPKYMVPNYFMCLEGIPMTASGKTDRKKLPLPDFTQSKNEYVAPKTDMESKLCSLVGQLFGLKQISVTDDFFELGGDSLKAIEYIAKAHNFGVEIGLQAVFDYPTVRELCDFLVAGNEKEPLYSEFDFEKYEELLSRNVLDENFVPKKKSLGNILLTGATGFLGAHILDSFMREESGTVYCLVRGGEEKLKDTLHYYFDSKYDGAIGQRIIPVLGDITDEFLSKIIPNDVQTIIHTAATVKHYGSYKYFHEVNVQGTHNIISYANHVGAKLIHISTISVSGNSFADAFTVYRSEEEMNFNEQSLYIGQELNNVYVRSKFEAEMAVFDAAIDGLDAKIVRVGNLTNRASDFKFQPNYEQNAFLTRIKAALEFGRMPEYLMPLYAEFSPIDETAEGVIKIAQYADKQNVFHLNSNKPIYFTRLFEVIEKLNISMEIVGGEEFSRLLQEYAKNSETEYIYEAFQNDMDENGNLVYDSNIHIINDFTVEFLKNVGFEWTQIDFEYIKGYVEYFQNLEYLEV